MPEPLAAGFATQPTQLSLTQNIRQPKKNRRALTPGIRGPPKILENFPDLTRENLKACIAYATDRECRLMTAPFGA
ncbi:MAG TPA: hypothetical protein VGB07_35250 [Blastocatellia bacterium]